MQLKFLRDHFYSALQSEYPETEIHTFFKFLAEAYLQMKGIDVALNLSADISEDAISKFEEALIRLKNHEPIQYILGITEFCGRDFEVTRATLIPRPETEELVQWIIEATPSTGALLDIGTGTGCIPISIGKEKCGWEICAIDISADALKVAEKNAKANAVNVQFFEFDILKWESKTENAFLKNKKFDLIVSNPPYVRHLEKEHMSLNVFQHEPELALFVADDNPLIFYEKIAAFADFYLNSGGKLFFEINQYLGAEMIELMEDVGFKNVLLKKDMFGNDRMICGVKR